jgi:squalene synthase HpnC
MSDSHTAVDEAYKKCRQQAEKHYENFPVGSLLLPKKQRAWIHAVYAFARTADDFADENIGQLSVDDRLELLDRWGQDLDQATRGKPQGDIFIALRRAIREARLDVQLLHDLLSAFRQDVVKNRYANFQEVLDYCRRSANPVGRLVLQIFDYRDEERARLSDHICTALQLANFWQDISVDIRKDRIYLPIEEMQTYGVTVDSLKNFQVTTGLRELVKFQCARTREIFEKGKPLIPMLDKALKLEIKLTWLGGVEILKLIEKQNFDTLSRRPHITKMRAVLLLMKALLKNWKQ